ncbi:MAG: magnesium transporter CorA family protein [Rickettsiales bacterium]|nr:magnesium transporter CorA family protein [Rickettsiales bacterium]
MITIYHKLAGAMHMTVIGIGDTVPAGVAWIDLYNPTADEEHLIESQLNIEILTREEIWKNQVLNRFYQEDGAAYMTAAIINKVDSPYPQTSAITFIMTKDCLVTLRYITPTSFSNFAQRMIRSPQKFGDGADILEGLLEEIITRVAYNSEIVVNQLDKLSHDIFNLEAFEASRKNPSQMMKEVLQKLGNCADLNSKINESLHSLNRLLTFFRQLPENSNHVNNGLNTLVTDIKALSLQTAFLSDKVTFQLDATLGMINVEQNMIVKLFSMVTVFLMPATLISSIYGMNFEYMPELKWIYGYPYALTMIVLCALVPYFYFRRKGWL